MSLLQNIREIFVFLCPQCQSPYHTVVENGKSKFLHQGLTSTKDKTRLSSPNCIPYHDYLVFQPCGHCCPDVFGECRACKLGLPGAIAKPSHPTKEDCYCHYCLPEPEMKKPELRSTSPKARKRKTVPQANQPSPINITVQGGDVNIRDITGGNKITTNKSGIDARELAELVKVFAQIKQDIDHRVDDPKIDKTKLRNVVESIQEEVEKGKEANPNKVERLLRNLAKMSEDIFQVTVATLASPAAGVAKVIQLIAQRAKAETSK